MIIKFLIRNTLIIQEMIDKLNTQTPSLPIYKTTVKTFIKYTAAEVLVREITIKKLKEAVANKKNRSKKIIGLTIIYPETWEIHLQEQRKAKRAIKEINKAKRETAALRKINGKDKITSKATDKTTGKSKGKSKGKNKSKNNNQLTIKAPEKAINHEKNNDIEAQLTAELEATIFNEITTTTRSSRIRRAPVRYRNSCSL
jgi:hypothetical protein